MDEHTVFVVHVHHTDTKEFLYEVEFPFADRAFQFTIDTNKKSNKIVASFQGVRTDPLYEMRQLIKEASK